MDEELGPIFVDNEDGFSSERLNAEVEKKAQSLLKELYEKTCSVISAHRKQLDALAQALLEHEVLVGDEIKRILEEAEKVD